MQLRRELGARMSLKGYELTGKALKDGMTAGRSSRRGMLYASGRDMV